MSKHTEKGVRGDVPGSDSPKTLIARAKREVPGFRNHFLKLEQQMVIGGYSSNMYFKHTDYGLRFFFRLYDLEDRVLQLPKISKDRKVPISCLKERIQRCRVQKSRKPNENRIFYLSTTIIQVENNSMNSNRREYIRIVSTNKTSSSPKNY
jgi:hypothetical protein